MSKNKMLHKFIAAVEVDDNNGTPFVRIPVNLAHAAKEFIEARIEAARKGGKASKRFPIDLSEKAEKNRARVKRYYEKKRISEN